VPKGAVLPRLLILFDSGGARFRGNVCREDLHSGQRYVVEALFTHLTGRWCDLLNVCFEVLLYDLTSTYFESDPPLDENDEHHPAAIAAITALSARPHSTRQNNDLGGPRFPRNSS
jgi:hypothetical protein